MPTPRDQLTRPAAPDPAGSRRHGGRRAGTGNADGSRRPARDPGQQSAVSLECSRASLELIVRFEVGSRQRYEKEFQRPTWPGGMSGVTIGIGYDLGMTPKGRITSDWECYLFEPELAALLAVQGVTGPAAKQLARGVSHVKIPLKSAEEVLYLQDAAAFCRAHAGRVCRRREAPAGCAGRDALAGVQPRCRVVGRSPPRNGRDFPGCCVRPHRTSMPLRISSESMKRLWPDMKGLRDRRRREAQVIRGAERNYTREEIIRV